MTARTIPPPTLDAQARASRPDASAWVSAHAGSGKTHVLTQRVIRLLLKGAPASRIVCLTYTKAAAANMSLRVFNTLAQWTALDDDALARAIAATGSTFRAELAPLARKLFSRTLETPGGLKIQTIHGFCESVLHQFPFEANVPSGFQVLDDAQKIEFLAQAKIATFQASESEPALQAALGVLAAHISAKQFEALVDDALNHRTVFGEMAHIAQKWPHDYDRLVAPALGLRAGEDRAYFERLILAEAFPHEDLQAWMALLRRQGSAQDFKLAERMRLYCEAPQEMRIDSYFSIFFTTTGEPYKSFVTKAVAAIEPLLLGRIEAEAARLKRLGESLRAADALARSHALASVVVGVLQRYTALKRDNALLDFDDLIERTLTLFSRSDAQWVLYKLDSSIDHILVDEAQDTSDEQWRILDALAAEFTAGRGQGSARRTFFAVGDEKQSIYSFQGAEPRLFDEARRRFSRRAEAAQIAHLDVKLSLSFRSATGVLQAVDTVFSDETRRRGLTSEGLAEVHEPWKRDLPSIVEIWTPVGPDPEAPPPDWRLPVDALHLRSPAAILAERVTELVRRLLDPASGGCVHDEALAGFRPVAAGDIMILLRRRGALFEALNQSLKRKGLDVAGADRLVLKDHLAVMDLIALGKASLLPEDDLALACVLKSPLIGLGDEDLLALAPRRPGSLSDALEISPEASHRAAADQLKAWRRQARERSPYAFFADICEAQGGRAGLLARLGPEAGDVVDEFLRLALAEEKLAAPSLTRFLHQVETGEITVKRDMEAASRSVRVMTVHAAKGLESKIVILPDTCQTPDARLDSKLFRVPLAPRGRALVWSQRKDDDCEAIAAARERGQNDRMDEYRRLLYVAMTRAEERLYVMGCHGKKPAHPESWHTMIAQALEPHLQPAPAFWNPDECVHRFTDDIAHSAPSERATSSPDEPAVDLPDWLRAPAPTPSGSGRSLRPSGAPEAADLSVDVASADAAMAAGRAMHALLQSLPAIAPQRREQAAAAILEREAPGLGAQQRSALAWQARDVLELAELAPLFAPDAVAEAPIAGAVKLASGETVHVVGRVDRLAAADGVLWLAEFKTGSGAGPAPQAYVRQMALYAAALAKAFPEHEIRCLLVWTAGPRVVRLERPELERALASGTDQEAQPTP